MTELPFLAGSGWLPVAIDDRRESVVLAEVGDLDARAPSFGAALAQLGHRRVRLVPIEEFVTAAAALECGRPARVVAHVGRCGSTLLANLLALRPAARVLKEPSMLHPRDPALLRALMTYCRAEAAAAERDLIVKLTSWSCPALLAAIGDQARWLLLWRDPHEVVASELAEPPRWASSARVRRELAPDGCDPVEVFGRAWVGIVEAFLPEHRRRPVPVSFLDYAELAADRVGALRATQSWFALSSPECLPPGFEAEAVRYSKATDGSTFDPAERHSRRRLDPTHAARVAELTDVTAASLRTSGEALRW